MYMNQNRIIADCWSNDDSKRLYELKWPEESNIRKQYEEGQQCGGCSFFAPFNYDWGLCCHTKSGHHFETVFEHFTCAMYVGEGWSAHSFSEVDLDAIFDKARDPGGSEEDGMT
jgi:hypothetical protein